MHPPLPKSCPKGVLPPNPPRDSFRVAPYPPSHPKGAMERCAPHHLAPILGAPTLCCYTEYLHLVDSAGIRGVQGAVPPSLMG